MRITITGRNIELTDGIKEAVNDKLSKLEKYFKPDTDVFVTLSVEKERQKIEITIPMKGNIVRAEQVSDDMYVSIDLVEEIIERQLRKYKNKIVDQQQSAVSLSKAFVEEEIEDDDELEEFRLAILKKIKRLNYMALPLSFIIDFVLVVMEIKGLLPFLISCAIAEAIIQRIIKSIKKKSGVYV